VRRYEVDFHAGTDFSVAPKTTIRLDFRELDYEFAEDEPGGYDQQLNRTLRAAEFSYRQRLTALTTFLARFSRETERFDNGTLRNSDSFRANAGFEMGRFALIRGTAILGYRKMTPADGGLFQEFSGLTANVNATYTAPTRHPVLPRESNAVLRADAMDRHADPPGGRQVGRAGTGRARPAGV
jgi:hypothetical protein